MRLDYTPRHIGVIQLTHTPWFDTFVIIVSPQFTGQRLRNSKKIYIFNKLVCLFSRIPCRNLDKISICDGLRVVRIHEDIRQRID